MMVLHPLSLVRRGLRSIPSYKRNQVMSLSFTAAKRADGDKSCGEVSWALVTVVIIGGE